jgi:hypothetical protein
MDGFDNWHLKPLDPIQTQYGRSNAIPKNLWKVAQKNLKINTPFEKGTKIIYPLTWYIKIIFHTMEYITRYLIHTEIKSCRRSICVSNAKMVKIWWISIHK